RKILSALYQPIVGHQAMALYFTLWSEVEIDRIYSSPSYINRLSKIMQMDLKSIEDSFALLEALGLINSFSKRSDNQTSFQFIIYSPDKPKYFFKNPLLVSKLKQALGKDDYIKTKLLFQYIEKDLDGYENISNKYSDVFSLQHDPNCINTKEQYKQYDYAKIEGDYDFSLLKEALRDVNLAHLLANRKIKDSIEMIMMTYNITTLDLVDLIVESYDGQQLNVDQMITNIDLKTRIDTYKSSLELVHLRNNDAANIFEKNSVAQFLKDKFKALKIDHSDLLNIEKIMKDYEMHYGVCNVLLDFVIKQNGNININYVKAIAKSWQQENINTVEQAQAKVKAIQSSSTKPKKKQYNNKTTIGTTDTWYQEKEEPVDEEVALELREILKRT
ncbi:MAG: DnaD domain protein, partial [Erysipelotrichales bacterium]